LLGAVAGQEMADQGSGQAFDELLFFIRQRVTEAGGFFAFLLLQQKGR